MTPVRFIQHIRSNLSDDLLSPRWRVEVAKAVARGSRRRGTGHCYIAAEALYHLLGGRRSGHVPHVLSYKDGATHWFLRTGNGAILDPTADQFLPRRPAYSRARPCGFLTRAPSRRAQALIKRVRAAG